MCSESDSRATGTKGAQGGGADLPLVIKYRSEICVHRKFIKGLLMNLR